MQYSLPTNAVVFPQLTDVGPAHQVHRRPPSLSTNLSEAWKMQFKSSVYIKVSKDEETAAPRISHSMVLRDEDPSGHSESRFDDGEDKTKLPKSIVELSLNQPPPSTHTIWRCHVCGNNLMSYATQIVCPKCSHQCFKACTMTIEPANTTAADIVSTNDSKIQTANNDMLDPEGLPNTTP